MALHTGADGARVGTPSVCTGSDGSDSGPCPTSLWGTTQNTKAVPDAKPSTVVEVPPMVRLPTGGDDAAASASRHLTSYTVMGASWSPRAAAAHATSTDAVVGREHTGAAMRTDGGPSVHVAGLRSLAAPTPTVLAPCTTAYTRWLPGRPATVTDVAPSVATASPNNASAGRPSAVAAAAFPRTT